MAPKFARLLSDARPSARGSAIRRLGARAVRGPLAERVEEGREMVHRPVRDGYTGRTVICSVR